MSDVTTPNGGGGLSSRLSELLFRPVDIASLVAFRIIFGGCMLYESIHYYVSGYLQEYLIHPQFHFKFYGFTWVRELPEPVMHIIFVAMAIAAAMVMVGAWYRIASAALAVTFSYSFLLEATQYRNHWYLLALLSILMAFLPAHRAASVDARRRPEIASRVVARWPVLLIQVQLGLVYFFAGVAKLSGDWISGSSMRAIVRELPSQDPEQIAFLLQDWVIALFVWSGLLFDLLIAFALAHPRTRKLAYIGAAGFHITNGTFLVAVGVFPWFMLMASSIYFAPSWPRTLLNRIGWTDFAADEGGGALPGSGHRRWVVGLLSVHLAIQLFLPLRQHLPIYDGPTSWTHEGHRWAWRMKMISKRVDSFSLWSVDPDTGARVDLTPNVAQGLRPFQREIMARQPDLLLQFAHDLHDQLRERFGKEYPIYADVVVRLNGRPPMPLIDSTRDLSREEWTLGAAEFIAPMARTRY
ncbi:MAG: HTTM domain-containing protein [Planctomycetota bacterium]|jgi:hypothetical protein